MKKTGRPRTAPNISVEQKPPGVGLFTNPRFFHNLRRSFCSPRLKPFHSASGVYQFLFSGIERMAFVANFNAELFFRGSDGKRIAAVAADVGFGEICGVDIFFHTR